MKWREIKKTINDTVDDNDDISMINMNFHLHTDIEIDKDSRINKNIKDKSNSYSIRSVNEDIMEGRNQDRKW